MMNETGEFQINLHRLEIADYVVFVLTLIISLLIGFYYAFSGGRQKTVQEYLVGNRNMGIFPVTMSLLATFLSAMGMMSIPAEIYEYGAGLIYGAIGMWIAMPVVAYCYLPTFYELQLTSAYEYLERRFNGTLRKIGSFISILQLLVYISLVLYAPSLAMSHVTGLNLWGTVIAIGLLGTVYTSMGGIKGVMWTDVFQILVVFISLTLSIVKGAVDVGGFSYVYNKGLEGGRLDLSLKADARVRYSIYSVTFASFFKWLSFYGVNQMLIQRYVSSPSMKQAKLTVILNLVGNTFFNLITLAGGLVIYAKYWDCDPITTKMVQSADQVLPLFVIETLHGYPGLSGLFVAGLFCGSLSTISSALNSLAAMALEDFIRTFQRWKNLSSERAATISKILTASFGVLCLALVPLFSTLGRTIIPTNSYNSHTFLGIIFALFTLGMFVPWSNSFGASVGIAVGFVFSQWMSIGTQLNKPFTPKSPISVEGCVINSTFRTTSTDFADAFVTTQSEESDIFPLYQIAFNWIMCLSAMPVLIVGTIVSALYKPTKIEDLDPRLLSPIVRFIIRKYWPDKLRNDVKNVTDEPQPDILLLDATNVKDVNLELNYA